MKITDRVSQMGTRNHLDHEVNHGIIACDWLISWLTVWSTLTRCRNDRTLVTNQMEPSSTYELHIKPHFRVLNSSKGCRKQYTLVVDRMSDTGLKQWLNQQVRLARRLTSQSHWRILWPVAENKNPVQRESVVIFRLSGPSFRFVPSLAASMLRLDV